MDYLVALMGGWFCLTVAIGIMFGFNMARVQFPARVWAEDVWVMLSTWPVMLGMLIGAGVRIGWSAARRTIPLRWFAVVAIALCLVLIGAPPALAADGGLNIPWGDWLAPAILTIGGPLIVGGLTWAFHRLPANLRAWFDQRTVAQVLGTPDAPGPAIQWGLNAVAGAVRGRTLDVQIGSQVAFAALDYVVRHAPDLFARLGQGSMLEMIYGRLPLDENAAVEPMARPAR